MEQEIEELKKQVEQNKQVLGTLITWLISDLGIDNVNKLLSKLNNK